MSRGITTRRELFIGSLAGIALGTTSCSLVRPAHSGSTSPLNATEVSPASSAAPAAGHQAGTITDPLPHARMIAFDILPDRPRVQQLLRAWTRTVSQARSAELAINIGLGASIFTKLGASHLRPEALVDLPAFSRDQLVAADSGGDLLIQLTARNSDMLDEAEQLMTSAATRTGTRRWTHNGTAKEQTPEGVSRNPLGFKDGTGNPRTGATRDIVVWADADSGPAWMTGGTYLVFRRIRLDLPGWRRLSPERQERIIGRSKPTGAPLSGGHENDPLNFTTRSKDGELAIPAMAHARRASLAFNQGAQILRRGFNYDNGAADRGMLFLAYQRDPRQGFITIQNHLDAGDALSKFTTTIASAVFALPPTDDEHFIGQELFTE